MIVLLSSSSPLNLKIFVHFTVLRSIKCQVPWMICVGQFLVFWIAFLMTSSLASCGMLTRRRGSRSIVRLIVSLAFVLPAHDRRHTFNNNKAGRCEIRGLPNTTLTPLETSHANIMTQRRAASWKIKIPGIEI